MRSSGAELRPAAADGRSVRSGSAPAETAHAAPAETAHAAPSSGAAAGSGRAERALAALVALACLLGAALAWRRVFETPFVLRSAVPAAALAFAVTLAAGRGRPRVSALLAGLATTLLAAVGVAALVATPALSATPEKVSAARSVLDAVRGGWSQILSTTLPVAPTVTRLPVAALTSGVAGVLVALLVLSRRPVLAALPAVGLLGVALGLGVGGAGSVAAVALPVAVPALALLAVGGPSRRGGDSGSSLPASSGALPPLRGPGLISAAGAVAVLVGVAALAPALASRLPHHPPYDKRSVDAAPVDVREAADPVSMLSARLAAGSARTMFFARVEPAVAAARLPWRLAAFDSYDGVGWSASSSAHSVGVSLVGGSLPAGTHTVSVRVVDLTGPWIPTLAEPVGVRPADLRFDPAAGALLDPAGMKLGGGYTLQVRLPERDPLALSTAPVASGARAGRSLPCLPVALEELAARVDKPGSPPAVRAQALADALAHLPKVSVTPAAPPGVSCGRIAALLTSTDKRATSEQFATAFVLAARHVGLPTRLSVGFRPGQPDASGRIVVTGADAYAWPEVHLGAGLGWVAFDPTPSGVGDSRPRPAPPTLKPAPAVTATPQPAPPPQTAAPTPARVVPPTSSAPVWPWVLLAFAVLVPVGLASAVVVAKARRRRSRRSRPDPRLRVAGAWEELLDRLAEQGLSCPEGTATAVAEAVVAPWSTALVPAVGLVSLVNGALYDPRPVAAAQADQAWTSTDAVVKAVRAGQRPWARWRTALSPAALRRPAQVVVAVDTAIESPLMHRNGPDSSGFPSPVGILTTKQ